MQRLQAPHHGSQWFFAERAVLRPLEPSTQIPRLLSPKDDVQNSQLIVSRCNSITVYSISVIFGAEFGHVTHTGSLMRPEHSETKAMTEARECETEIETETETKNLL